jgi:hypothetical protein
MVFLYIEGDSLVVVIVDTYKGEELSTVFI